MLEEPMKIFISWSGERSKRVAKALKQLIGDVIQVTEPWMSPDIQPGAWWSDVLRKQLSNARFGIVCITKDNLDAPWLHFEAGALAKAVERQILVCPYLIDLESTQLANTPLAHLQAKRAIPSETWDLIEAINEQLGEKARPSEQLKRMFDLHWPELDRTLKQLPESEEDGPERAPEEMIEEILVMVRDLTRRPSDEEANARIIIMALQKAGMDDDDIAEHLVSELGMSRHPATMLVSYVRSRFSSF
jgi:hypothetical protein